MFGQAIEEARAAARARDASSEVTSQDEKEGKYTSSQLLSKFFKRPSEKVKKLGKAQLLYEDMVRRAEKKLYEMHRQSHAESQDDAAKAEELAKELFHRPGTLMTKDDIAHFWQESGCRELREVPDCNFPTVNLFRTIDGTCNNRENPFFGASGTAFTRLTPAVYEDGISSLRGGLQARSADFFTIGPFVPPNPSARLISSTVVQKSKVDEIPFTHILMQWGQFLDHDLDLGPELEAECESCTFTDICEPIFVADGDRAFGVGTRQNGDCLTFRRSIPTCDISGPGSFLPREQANDLTSFIDGSQVYGSNEIIGRAVRAFDGGLLRTGPNFPGNLATLPVDTDNIVACPNRQDCFLAGDVRANEQISLSIQHTIWLREHNRIATELGNLNPLWDDERIFQEARKIVGAMISKITYIDYLPKVLGPDVFNLVIGPYLGYDPEVNPGVPNSFAGAAYRYGHSLIRPQFDRLGPDFQPLAKGPLNLVEAFFRPDQFQMSMGTDPILRGLVSVNSRRVDEFLNRVLTTKLFQTSISPGMDLASLNIQRGRDHGLAPYPVWKNFCERVFGIANDFENSLTLVRFLELYGSLETLDLWVGGLAEERLPGSLLGATFACIFGITFANVRNGDRFYFENPGVFTPSQLSEIRDATLSHVICDNSDNIDLIQPDAFLSNQSRVSCDTLPVVDLTKWQEAACYMRTRIVRPNFDGGVRVFSRSIQANFVLTSAAFRASSSDRFVCVPITCPTADVSDRVITYIVNSNSDFCNTATVSNNAALPRSRHRNPSIYRARWPRSNFGSDGVYLSLAECQSSSSAALSFSIAGVQQDSVKAEVDHLTHLLQKDKTTSNPESPETDEEVPTDVLDILDDENPDAVLQELGSESSNVTVSAASDEKLMEELEVALKALN